MKESRQQSLKQSRTDCSLIASDRGTKKELKILQTNVSHHCVFNVVICKEDKLNQMLVLHVLLTPFLVSLFRMYMT